VYTNKITKGLYELGSIFKTFTVALALNEDLLEPNSIIKNITKKIKCSKYEISDIHEFPTSMTVQDILIQSSNIGAIKIARKIGEKKYKDFLHKLNLLSAPEFELDEVSTPKTIKWNKCKLETVSFGHGIMITPLQAAAAYASISNGGYIIKPTLIKTNNKDENMSEQINKMLRKVVTDQDGTATMADIFGYHVGGKTGTAQSYDRKNENINTFISVFPAQNPSYVLLVLLDNPQAAPHIVYEYKGQNITNLNRNEAGWNSVYVAGKIIKKIGPILAINNEEFYNNYVVKKSN
jgi:cell division protein FtsI (penicillin-binding protein 3)